MLTTEVTPELVEGWKRIFEANRLSLHPNRKTGKGIDDYFRKNIITRPLTMKNFARSLHTISWKMSIPAENCPKERGRILNVTARTAFWSESTY